MGLMLTIQGGGSSWPIATCRISILTRPKRRRPKGAIRNGCGCSHPCCDAPVPVPFWPISRIPVSCHEFHALYAGEELQQDPPYRSRAGPRSSAGEYAKELIEVVRARIAAEAPKSIIAAE